MKKEEIIKTLEIAVAEVEWNFPMDYAIALEEAMQAVNITKTKNCEMCQKRNACDIRLKYALDFCSRWEEYYFTNSR